MTKPGMKAKDSIDSLKERMSRDPFSRAFLQLAEEYRKAGRYDEAVRVCMEGLTRHPTYHTARIALGRTYLEKGDLESARRALSEVLELAPENHLAAKLLAEVQRRIGDLSGAAQTYRAILHHYPGDREIEALLRDLQGPKGDEGSRAPATPPGPRPAAAPGPPQAARLAPTASEPSFDYHPEDIVVGASKAAPAPRGATAPAVREGRLFEGQPAAVREERDALQTNTLAELYLRQGHVERALEVYRAMLRLDPGNEGVRRRLSELGANEPPAAGGAGRGAVAPSPERGAPPPATASRSGPPHPGGERQAALSAGPQGEGVARPVGPVRPPASGETVVSGARVKIARLERWLDAMRAGASRP